MILILPCGTAVSISRCIHKTFGSKMDMPKLFHSFWTSARGTETLPDQGEAGSVTSLHQIHQHLTLRFGWEISSSGTKISSIVAWVAGWFTKIQHNPLVLNKRALDYRCFVMNTRSLSPEVSTYYPLAFVAELRQKVSPTGFCCSRGLQREKKTRNIMLSSASSSW